MKNIVKQYIELARKNLTEYMKLIFDDKYDKEISDEYIEKYINTRYYNYVENENTTLKTRTLKSLKNTRARLLITYPDKTEIIEDMYLFYHYIMYIDNTLWCKSIDEIIEKMSLTRIKLSLNENTKFCEKIKELVVQNNKQIENLLSVEDFDKFYLKIKNIDKDKKIYDVKLEYNIKFPEIYSEKSKEKVFDTGIVKEDKLFVEYYLTSIAVLKDIMKARFNKQYMLEFASTLFEKNTKIERLLSCVENEIVQEKINFKVYYSEFVKDKENFYSLMRRGYKIAIILDETFEDTDENIDRLEIFSYILVDSKWDKYTRIKKEDKLENKVIAIEKH